MRVKIFYFRAMTDKGIVFLSMGQKNKFKTTTKIEDAAEWMKEEAAQKVLKRLPKEMPGYDWKIKEHLIKV